MYYLTDFNGTTIVPSSQMIHSLNLEELSVFLNMCDSQSVLFSISVFLNLCDSQLVFFSICAILNLCNSQLVFFSIKAVWGRHRQLDDSLVGQLTSRSTVAVQTLCHNVTGSLHYNFCHCLTH